MFNLASYCITVIVHTSQVHIEITLGESFVTFVVFYLSQCMSMVDLWILWLIEDACSRYLWCHMEQTNIYNFSAIAITGSAGSANHYIQMHRRSKCRYHRVQLLAAMKLVPSYHTSNHVGNTDCGCAMCLQPTSTQPCMQLDTGSRVKKSQAPNFLSPLIRYLATWLCCWLQAQPQPVLPTTFMQ